MRSWWETLFHTPKCRLCDSPHSAPAWAPIWRRVCSPCIERLAPIQGTICPRCGRAQLVSELCWDCKKLTNPPLTANRSSLSYLTYSRACIHRLKYQGQVSLAPPLAEMMVHTLLEARWCVDSITFVPLHSTRLFERGFNQAEMLAQEIAKRVSLPLAHCLERVIETPAQSSRGKRARQQTLVGAIVLKEGLERHVRSKHWLLIDDVYTTGATLLECARTLKKAGANKVYSLTLAR
ncbi:ComF family protein [Marininema halotolerans]|uniref:ComF family protein n=1 Tax=Marininema halotolerans TaxID=1155944 RepID=A0A1I6NZZ2_9BACL|nr:ComF family protein [Marininema halotolerans]SFS33523.1 comF family protein [Marininema halotolerans]